MTVNQLLKFADEHAHDVDGFASIDEALYTERIEIIRKLESDPDNKQLKKQLNDAIEKLAMIDIMKVLFGNLFVLSIQKQRHISLNGKCHIIGIKQKVVALFP